jgi:hypothetical protein
MNRSDNDMELGNLLSERDAAAASTTVRKDFAIKLGALAVGLVVVAYIGVRLGEATFSLPFLSSAAHVLTPEEQVQQEVASNPALVSRDACMKLYIGAPAILGMLSHPSAAQLDSMSDDELRSWAVTVITTQSDQLNPSRVMAAKHEVLVQQLQQMEATPRFANTNGLETRRIDAYLNTCRSMYPGRDEVAASYVRVRAFKVIRLVRQVFGRYAEVLSAM